jgi:hypothetical protein
MKTLALLAALVSAVVAGCDAGDAGAPDAGVAAPASTRASADVALARQSLSGSSLPKLQLIATAEGREALAQLVSCALPAGTTINAVANDGTPYLFAGNLGLAPAWAEHAPSPAERGRVTACVHGHAPGPAADRESRPMVGTLEPAHRRR